MKKRWFVAITFFVFILLSISLCACSHEEPGPKTVVYNGKIYTIDEEAMTISDNEHIYRYEVSGSGSSMTIYYPNGSSYYWTWSGNVGHGGWSNDYDESFYADGRTLMNVLETQMPKESELKNIPMIILLLIVGVFNTAAPQTAWYLSEGWRFKDAEPSDTALGVTRISGIAVIVIAIFMMIA